METATKMNQQPNDIEQLAKLFSKLPGLGGRSARRIVLHLLNRKDTLMLPLAEMLVKTAESIQACEACGNLDSQSPCQICESEKRDRSTLCVVEEVADLWAMERSHAFRGLYHVIGGTLSALDGRGPDQLNIQSLIERVENGNIEEVILATNATIDGQTTAHYITERLKPFNVTISRIAQGIPLGGELDYLDDGTLGAALQARRPF